MLYVVELCNCFIVEDLIYWFLEIGNNECFVVCFFMCYDLFSFDVVLELVWRYSFVDFVMFYIV